MGSRPSFRLLLQCVLASCLICQTLAVKNDVPEEETCAQGFAPAKRTLQAAHRNAPRTVMSSSEQVKEPATLQLATPLQELTHGAISTAADHC